MAEHEESTKSTEIISENITLYWMSGQIASWKIRIALEEKQLQGYKSIMVIRPDQMDKSADFWKNNERGIIPSLKIQNMTLNGVLPTLLFLETSKATLLSYSSAEEKALMLERAFETLEFQRACSEDLISYVLSFDHSDIALIDTDIREKREKILFGELIRWNDYFSQNSTSDIAHMPFTLVDVLFFPELALAVRFGLSLDYFSSLSVYYEALSKRSSIRKTWPYHWLHTTNTYDWLSKTARFAAFYHKQPAVAESASYSPVEQDTTENIDFFNPSSEETESPDD